MSEQDDLYDPYENNGGGGGNNAPVVSWKYARPGEKFTGVVMPPKPVEQPGKGYAMGREYQDGTDSDPDDKGFLVWPVQNNTQGIKRPVTEAKFATLWPGEEMRKVSRVEITLATDYKAGEFLSDSMKSRLADADKDVSSVTERRAIRSGADLPHKIDAALKAIGADRPMPGQRWTITLEGREPNKGRQGTTSRYKVEIAAPTAETKAMVQAYIEKATSAAPSEDGDPYTNEPPF